MAVRTLAHAAFFSNNVERMIDFYCNILGFERAFTMSMESPYQWALEDANNTNLPEETRAARAAYAKALEQQRESMWLTYLRVSDNQFIELFREISPLEAGNITPGSTARQGYNHMAIVVDDLQSEVQKIQARGGHFRTPISLGPDYTYQCWIDDPDGNMIEYMEYTDRSLQLVR